ncbi:triacylglycerol lipase OBL1-like [Aristolochia californica]|uniref:triacylglycerol lipase OBL1-like n=1 Tax=Aristolochia californica TaxID=171875 RepID=UPI0035E3B750
MASASSSEYLICRHEKVRWIDLLSLLILRKNFVDYHFVEASMGTRLELGNAQASWPVSLSLFLLKILSMIKVPMKKIGFLLEYACNLFALNGSFFGLINNIFTGKLVIPVPGTADYRSALGFLDDRFTLYKDSSLLGYFPSAQLLADDAWGMDAYIMAAKTAYESKAFIMKTVLSNWKMTFVEYFNCWNKFLNEITTQAFIFCDKPVNADVIVVAFRGTEPFNTVDWSTDVDFSWLRMGKLGRVHVGFMKALGLQDEKDYIKGWPKNFNSEIGKPAAYYAIRDTLKKLLVLHPNAHIVVTGHSLGGALAAIFPAILKLHEETAILNKLVGVVTFGQPRVGDKTFANYMATEVVPPKKKVFFRAVYRFDIVPRVPFDNFLLFEFKHYGSCFYFKSWYEGEFVEEEPNQNYFNIKYIIPMYWNAWVDLYRGITIGFKQKEFKEGPMSIGFRLIGLLIPGAASHSPRDYVNGARLGTAATVPDYKEELV